MGSDLIRLSALLDDAKCFDLIRQHRWPDGVRCPSCDSTHVVRNGWGDAGHTRQRWLCKDCKARFDDLTGTVLAGHHQPLRVWVLCACISWASTCRTGRSPTNSTSTRATSRP